MRVFVFTAQSEFFVLSSRQVEKKKETMKIKRNFFFIAKIPFLPFFLSRIEPRPNTDILHIVSSWSRFK